MLKVIIIPLFIAALSLLVLPYTNYSPGFAVVGCHLTKIGPYAPKDVVYPPGCQNGALPSADRVALLAQIKIFVDQGKIVFAKENDKLGMTNGSGVVKRGDGVDITIDTQVMRSFVTLANKGFTFTVSSMIGSHSKNVSGSGNVSRHWDGHAFDISVINGQDIDTGGAAAKPVTMDFMKYLNSLTGSDLEPKQIICSGNGRVDPEVLALQKGVSSVVAGHENHVHVGY
ncbi:MAG: hypothetical protein H0W89_03750 [Candidatus Levybacteria bacterium]|nr:hypothetical protein [Candidatus Levybacteria bacterium]